MFLLQIMTLESKLLSKDGKIQDMERELRNRVEVEEQQHKIIKQLKET